MGAAGIKIRDRVILMLVVGSVSAAIANAFGYLTKLFYPPAVVMPEVAAELFANPKEIHGALGLIFGNLWSLIVGGLHAFGLIVLLDLTGWRFIWWKSLAVTSAGWLVGVGLLYRGLNIAHPQHTNLLSSVLFFGAHLVYLTVAAVIVSRYGEPGILKR